MDVCECIYAPENDVYAQPGKGASAEEEAEEEVEEEEWAVPQCSLDEAVAIQPSGHGGSGLFALRDYSTGDGESRGQRKIYKR